VLFMAWRAPRNRCERIGDMSSSTTKAELARSRSSWRTSTSRIDGTYPERAV
jgi:hypothetical protein